MSYSVKTIDVFERQAARLQKKFASLNEDLKKLQDKLRENPRLGSPIGNDCYKIRMAIRSKGKGKSGGARVITCVQVIENSVYLIAIYDKSEQEDISNKELSSLLSFIPK